MNPDERKWAEEAIAMCRMATDRAVTIMFVRKQDQNGEADIIVSNTANPRLIAAMNGNPLPEDVGDDIDG